MRIDTFSIPLMATILLISSAGVSYGQDLSALGLPALTTVTGSNGETTYSLSLQILLLMTALTVLPSLVLGMTAFTRIIIVLSILRQALGTQQTQTQKYQRPKFL
jgi:flagellar biosynthetic protein FliP